MYAYWSLNRIRALYRGSSGGSWYSPLPRSLCFSRFVRSHSARNSFSPVIGGSAARRVDGANSAAAVRTSASRISGTPGDETARRDRRNQDTDTGQGCIPLRVRIGFTPTEEVPSAKREGFE